MADKVAGLLFRISADMKGLQQGFRQAQTAMGKLQSTVKVLGGAMLGAFAGRALIRGVGNMVNIVKDFEQSMADVKSITRATGSEFNRLENLAKTLGRETKFTASEVAQLEKEYAKLGFTTSEIEKAAKATLNLAAAVGADLARSAEVAGGVIRGFQMDAAETIRVTDVMARSFTNTALDMEKFAESMKYVAPVAKAAGLSVEETTALLGILANNMIDGSMAGTALRVILSKLSREGGTLQEKLQRLSDQGLDLADAEKEVGMRAQTALLVLTKQLDMLPDLTQAYEDAGGSAERMAEVQLATLEGALTMLTSAWQGLVIEIGTSNDAMEDSQKVIKGMASGLNWLTENLDAVSRGLKTYVTALTPVLNTYKLFERYFDKTADWWRENTKLFSNIDFFFGTDFNKAPTPFVNDTPDPFAKTPPAKTPPAKTPAAPKAPGRVGAVFSAGTSPFVIPPMVDPAQIEYLTLLYDMLENMPKITAPATVAITDMQMAWSKLGDTWKDIGIEFEEWAEIINQTTNIIRDAVVEMSASFVESIAEMAFASEHRLENIFIPVLGAIANVAGQLGRIAIGVGIGIKAIKEALKTLNPAVAIAAGIALLGLAGAARAAMGRLAGSFGGGASVSIGGGVSGPHSNFVPQRIYGDIVVQGSDLHIALSNYNRRRGRM